MQSGTGVERACPPLMGYLGVGISRNDEIALISYGILSNPLLLTASCRITVLLMHSATDSRYGPYQKESTISRCRLSISICSAG